jgi:hypothetical protein
MTVLRVPAYITADKRIILEVDHPDIPIGEVILTIEVAPPPDPSVEATIPEHKKFERVLRRMGLLSNPLPNSALEDQVFFNMDGLEDAVIRPTDRTMLDYINEDREERL